jgi:hypothetical protein
MWLSHQQPLLLSGCPGTWPQWTPRFCLHGAGVGGGSRGGAGGGGGVRGRLHVAGQHAEGCSSHTHMCYKATARLQTGRLLHDTSRKLDGPLAVEIATRRHAECHFALLALHELPATCQSLQQVETRPPVYHNLYVSVCTYQAVSVPAMGLSSAAAYGALHASSTPASTLAPPRLSPLRDPHATSCWRHLQTPLAGCASRACGCCCVCGRTLGPSRLS